MTGSGLICDSNSACSRASIAQKLGDAVRRRTELETLKSRQEKLLLSVIPAYLTDKVSQSIIANSSAAKGKAGKNQKLFHDLHVQVHDNVRFVRISEFIISFIQ